MSEFHDSLREQFNRGAPPDLFDELIMSINAYTYWQPEPHFANEWEDYLCSAAISQCEHGEFFSEVFSAFESACDTKVADTNSLFSDTSSELPTFDSLNDIISSMSFVRITELP